MANKAFNVLFVCAENSNRSILAEAVLRHWGKDRFHAFSAGISPSGQVDPLVIELLKTSHLQTEGLWSKSWQEFAAPGSPRMDFVISVGGVPAAEVARSLPGSPIVARWTITDPAPAGTDPAAGRTDPAAPRGRAAKQESALRRAFQELETRVRLFVLVRHEGIALPQPAAPAHAL